MKEQTPNHTEPQFRNSASRLHALLKTMTTRHGGRSSIAIPEMFNEKVEPDDTRPTYEAVAKLGRLLDDFESDLEAHFSPDRRATVLRGLKGLRETIFPAQLNNPPRVPTEAEMAVLEVTSSFMPEEGELKEDDVSRIKSSVSDLQNLVADSDVSPTLRKALLELIRLTENAISEFRINGVKGLKRAFKQMLGEAADLFFQEGRKPDDEKPSGWTKAWHVIEKHLNIFNAISTHVEKATAFVESGVKLAGFLRGNGDAPIDPPST